MFQMNCPQQSKEQTPTVIWNGNEHVKKKEKSLLGLFICCGLTEKLVDSSLFEINRSVWTQKDAISASHLHHIV